MTARLTSRRDVLNVREVGAAGNGTSDDTTAIHAARDAAGAGGQVWFPGGTYLVDGLTANIAGQTWILDPGATIKWADGCSAPTVRGMVNVTEDGVSIVGSGCLDGNAAEQTGTWGIDGYVGACVQAWSVDDFTMDGIEVKGSKGTGIDVRSNARTALRNLNLHTTDNACLYVDGIAGLTFIGNHLHNWARNHTYLEEGSHSAPAITISATGEALTHDAVISNNVFINTDATKFAIESCAGSWMEICSDSVISNNVFDGNGLGANGISGWFFRCSMTGNVHKNGGNTHRSGYEIVGTNNTISGNTIEHASIAVAAASGGSSRFIAISGNTISNSDVNGTAIMFGNNADQAVSDVVVDGNLIDMTGASGATRAISSGVYGASGLVNRISITNNRLKNDGTAVGVGVFSRGTAGSSDITIRGNVASGFLYGVLTDEGTNTTEVTIADNDVRNCTNPINHLSTGAAYRIFGNIETAGQIGRKRGTGALSPMDFSGTGSPETVITAPPGSTYARLDGSAGEGFYIKESGTAATGWVAK